MKNIYDGLYHIFFDFSSLFKKFYGKNVDFVFLYHRRDVSFYCIIVKIHFLKFDIIQFMCYYQSAFDNIVSITNYRQLREKRIAFFSEKRNVYNGTLRLIYRAFAKRIINMSKNMKKPALAGSYHM